MSLRTLLIVFVGSGIGGAARYGVNVWAARNLPDQFPYATFFVNVAGSLVMGLIAGYLAFKAAAPWSQEARLFLATGIMGGFTTFSAFSLDSMLLIERGALTAAALYVIGSVVLSIAALAAGLSLVRIAT